MGPILIFDKSTLQGLSVDESVWLENFFLTNLTPLFYVETLSDIEKKVKGNLTPQQIVDSPNYPFSMGQVRHILLTRHKNGLREATRKMGRRILLRKDLWEAWLENQAEGRSSK